MGIRTVALHSDDTTLARFSLPAHLPTMFLTHPYPSHFPAASTSTILFVSLPLPMSRVFVVVFAYFFVLVVARYLYPRPYQEPYYRDHRTHAMSAKTPRYWAVEPPIAMRYVAATLALFNLLLTL